MRTHHLEQTVFPEDLKKLLVSAMTSCWTYTAITDACGKVQPNHRLDNSPQSAVPWAVCLCVCLPWRSMEV